MADTIWQKSTKLQFVQNSKPQAFGKISLPLLVTYKLIARESLRIKIHVK
jgi:hypothetical protein